MVLRRFDPDGRYISRWVPELARLDAAWIHQPWQCDGGPPAGYAEPVVDHSNERAVALADYASIQHRR